MSDVPNDQAASLGITMSPLMTLPGELRNQIWSLCLRDAPAVTIHTKGESRPILSMARVSWQARMELLSLWPDERDHTGQYQNIRAQVLDLHFEPLIEFLEYGHENHDLFKYLETIEIWLVFSPAVCKSMSPGLIDDCESDICTYIGNTIVHYFGGAEFKMTESTVGVGRMEYPMLLSLGRVRERSFWGEKSPWGEKTPSGDREGWASAQTALEDVKRLMASLQGAGKEAENWTQTLEPPTKVALRESEVRG